MARRRSTRSRRSRRTTAAAEKLTAQNITTAIDKVIGAAVVQAAANLAAEARTPGTALALRDNTLPATVPERDETSGAAEDRMGMRSGLRSTAHRNRKALYPWGIAAGVAGGGHLAWLIGWGSDQSWLVAGVVGAAALVGSLAAARSALTRLPRGWAPWAVAAWLNGMTWLILTVAHGPSYERLVWLLVATAAFGARWWARVRRPYPTSGRDPREIVEPANKPAAAVVVEPSITRHNLVQRWDTYLGGKAGPLAGSTVDDPQSIEHGLVTTIHLVPGKQSRQSVLQALPAICTALDSYEEDTIIERHPTGPPSTLQLTLVTRPATDGAVLFDRPVYDNGRVLLGPYRDGVGNAMATLYSPNSMETGFVLGSRGSGKSRLLEKFALVAMAQGNTVVFYLDGQNGASSPLLWEHALWRGGPSEVPYFMEGMTGMMAYRQLYLRYHRLPGLAPSRKLPGILVIVDECHRIWDKRTVGWWTNGSREWRKLLGGIFAASQAATLNEAFAGSDALRSNLVAGNGIALRTMSSVQQQVFPGLRANLEELPKGGGHGYTVDEGDTGRTRTAPFRDSWLIAQSDVDQGLVVPPAGIRTAESWFAEVAAGQQLDPRTAAGGGDAFARRLDRAEHDRAELEQLFSGHVDTGLLQRYLTQSTSPTQQATAVPGGSADDSGDAGIAKVIRFPRFTAPGAPATQARPAATPTSGSEQQRHHKPAQLTAAQSRVWDVIAAGKGRPGEIAAVLNISTAAVHKHLTLMQAAGHIRRAQHGTYEPAS